MSDEKLMTYVVQTSPSMQKFGEEGRQWKDVAVVEVPPRTHRKTVVEKGLQQAGIVPVPGHEPLLVRAIDADSARPVRVTSEQPAPRLVIGGGDD